MATYDPVKNFGYSTVLTPPSPATSGTTLVIQSGDQSNFPDSDTEGAYNILVWPTGQQPTSANAELVRVTSDTTNTFTISRQQESTSARSIVAGDQVSLVISKKYRDDVIASIQKSSSIYAADAGSNDTYAITQDPAPTAYTTGMIIEFKANTINTGACTVNVNALGAKSLKFNGADPQDGMIRASSIVLASYDGTNFNIISIVNKDGWVDLTDGATITINLSSGRKFRVKQLGGNRILAISNIPTAAELQTMFLLELGQDGTGSRLISTWFTVDTTFATTDVTTGTDVIVTGDNIPTGTPIKFSSTTTVPAGLVAGTKYYAINNNTTSIKVASSLANAQAGTAIDITSQGTGTHTIQRLIRWGSDTEPTLTTGKYKVDTYVFSQVELNVFRGYTSGTDG